MLSLSNSDPSLDTFPNQAHINNDPATVNRAPTIIVPNAPCPCLLADPFFASAVCTLPTVPVKVPKPMAPFFGVGP